MGRYTTRQAGQPDGGAVIADAASRCQIFNLVI